MDKGSNKLASERMKAALKYFVSSKYEGPVPLRYDGVFAFKGMHPWQLWCRVVPLHPPLNTLAAGGAKKTDSWALTRLHRRTLLVPTAIESFDRKSAKAQQQAGAAIKAATTAMPDDKPKVRNVIM